MSIYYEVEPIGQRVPIIVSSPHSGTLFPKDLESVYKKELINKPDDTDWFIHQLYDFVPELGIKLISAVHSRWVIDLNRDPDSNPLYNDGRRITELCPTTDFLGNPLYKDGYTLTEEEISRRVDQYYLPYYEKIQQELNSLKAEFGYAILWDAHSIRQHVASIRPDPFPALILGDVDGLSSTQEFSIAAINQLHRKGYEVAHNTPFKGGHITRHFGKPDSHQHALQLEMTKVNYMDDAEEKYHKMRAGKMREALSATFIALLEKATQLYEKV